jgi:glucose/arabinose dehydrogenase
MKTGWKLLLLVAVAGIVSFSNSFKKETNPFPAVDESIKLPAGFSASIFAANTGRARHMAINTNGDVFVKLERLKNGKGILRLRDANKDGVAEDSLFFGNYAGTGITIKNGYLYASSDEDVYRYKLDNNGNVTNADAPEKIITGLFRKGGHHSSKSIALDNVGNIYVNIGAPSNICKDDSLPAPNPCPLLEKSGGIWQFKADKLNQTQADGVRYATGLRNVVGLDWNNEVNDLYVTQHGRDLLVPEFPTVLRSESGSRKSG